MKTGTGLEPNCSVEYPDSCENANPHENVDQLDPYAFMASLGKKVIHPGGKRSTEELFHLAGFGPGQRILDVGAGVGTTAIEIVKRFGCDVVAVDIDSFMLDKARANVLAAGLNARLTIEQADIQSLPYPDDFFDHVVIEAVTMFVDREKASSEAVRVCKLGGQVLDHEFIYRKPPTRNIRRIFEGEVCPGIRFDSCEDWFELYRGAGLRTFRHTTGPFSMMTPMGMLRDEGVLNLTAMMARTLSSPARIRKMTWMMSRMIRVWPYLGYVVLSGIKENNLSKKESL